MAENAERGVVFVLRTQIDPSARATLDQFAAEVQAKQAAVDSAITAAAAASAAAVAQNVSSVSTQVVNASQATANEFDKSVTSMISSSERFLDYEKDSAEDIVGAWTKAIEAKSEASSDALNEIEQNSRRWVDYEKDSAEDIVGAWTRSFEQTNQEREKSNTQALEGIRRQAAVHSESAETIQRRNEQINQSADKLVGVMAESTEAVAKLAGGFAYLGLVGETDLQKLQDSLLWIKGSTDIFIGLGKSIKSASDGYEAYRKLVILTTEAQVALNAAMTASVAVEGFSGSVGSSGRRTDRSSTPGIGDALGGAAVGAVGQAALNRLGTASAADAASSPSLMTRLAIGASSVGQNIAGVGGAIGLQAGASALGIFAAAIGAAVGAVTGLASAAATASEAMKFGAGGGATAGGMVERIGTSAFNPFFQIMRNTSSGGMLSDQGGDAKRAYDEAEKAEKRLSVAQEQRKLNLELQKRDEAEINRLKSEQAAITSQQAAIEKEMESARMSALTPEQRRAELVKQIGELEKNTTITAEQRGRAIIDLSRQRLQAEQEIHRTQLQAAQDAEREDQRKLADVNQRIEAERNAMLSAQERFGLMTAEEQQGVLDITQRFRQGAGNVDAEELRKIRGFSGAMDEQIAAEARRRAQAAGFGQVQAGDVQRLRGLERERATIEATVKADATVIAKLEVDSRQVADQINQQINGQFKVIMQSMAERIGQTALNVEKLEAAMLQRFSRL